jgi:osmotically inducible protein OsmC
MPTRTARTAWNGTLQDGSGQVELSSSRVGTYEVSFPKRAADEADGTTSPEELIAAAHSACFSMAFSNELSKAGHTVESIDTKADVSFQPGQGITGSHLTTRASVPGISQEEFAEIAEKAKKGCPVSSALTGTTITLDATLA